MRDTRALLEDCPHCHVAAGQHCRPARVNRFTKSRMMHRARIEVAVREHPVRRGGLRR